MPKFVALNHPDDTLQVNITMTDEAVRGTWYRESSSTATLDFENGEFLQISYTGHRPSDRQLRGGRNEPMLLLKNFIPGVNTGPVEFSIEDGPGTFGTGTAYWTRLEG